MNHHLTIPVLAAALLLTAGSANAQSGRLTGPFPVQNINPSVHRIVVTGSQTGFVVFDEFPLEPVPDGKRFVVEFVSAEVVLTTGEVPKAEIKQTSPSGPFYAIPLVKQLSVPIGDFFQASLLVRFYLDAGQTYILSANRNPAGPGTFGNFAVTLSGHLVDLPAP